MKCFSHSFYDENITKINLKIDDEGFSSIKLVKNFCNPHFSQSSLIEKSVDYKSNPKYGLSYEVAIIDEFFINNKPIFRNKKFYSIENIQQCINNAGKNYTAFQLLNIDNDNFFLIKDKLLVEIYQLSKLLATALTNPKIKYISFQYC
jgi:hypothetical protein